MTPSEQIQGWMTAAELAWLAERAALYQSVVEVGCWKGRTTTRLLDACPGTVYAVDHWEGSPRDGVVADHTVFAEFCVNIQDHKNLVILRGSSVEIAKGCPQVDMVFIDASHQYDDVVADIRAWNPKADRLLCGHDYDWGTVRQAVDDELLDVRRGPGSIWYVEFR